MAGIFSVDQKKKVKHHVDRNSRDGATGMSSSTKRHFESVKRKMLAFVDRKHRFEVDSMHFQPPPPPPPHHHHHLLPPPPMFVDQNMAPKQRSHHHTPLLLHKQLPHHHTPAPLHKQLPHHHTPAPLHKQLPHLALATPQLARRGGH